MAMPSFSWAAVMIAQLLRSRTKILGAENPSRFFTYASSISSPSNNVRPLNQSILLHLLTGTAAVEPHIADSVPLPIAPDSRASASRFTLSCSCGDSVLNSVSVRVCSV